MKLNVLLAKAKRMILTKYNLSEQSRETYRVLRSVDFRDWHIFKTECFTGWLTFSCGGWRDWQNDDDWSEALVDWLPVTD